jgi:hypothetical protein
VSSVFSYTGKKIKGVREDGYSHSSKTSFIWSEQIAKYFENSEEKQDP